MSAPTIQVQPANYYSSPYDPIIYELTWDKSAGDYDAKRMEALVTYGDDGATLGTITKQEVDINGTTSFRFDFSKMLQTILSYEFYNNISSDQINAPATAGDNRINNTFIVTFTPKWIDESGINQTDTATTASVRYVSNVVIPRNDTNRIIDTGSQWLAQNSTSKFLTHSPNNKVIRAGEDEQLSFIHDTGLQVEYNYQTYDLGGTANAAQTKALVTTDWRYGTLTISDNGASTVIDDFANISKIDVWIETSGATQITEKKTFLISQECAEGYRLWWGNSLGGFDKYTFNAYRNKQYKVNKRTNYTKANDSTPTIEERKGSTMSVSGNYYFEGVSEFVIEEYMDFFVDLLNSTNVYYQPYVDGAYSTEIHPVLVSSKDQVVYDSDGLIQVSIQFEYSEKQKTIIG